MMNRKMLSFLSLILFWSVTSVFGSTRTWTDDTGRFTVEAELEEVRGDSVVLRRVDGSQIVVPLARLSAADRDYLKSLSKAPKKPTPDRVPADGDVPSDSAPPLAIAPFDADTAREHQVAWADYLGVPVEFENSIGMKFVLIPPGEFDMGSTEEEVAKLLEEARAKNLRIIHINLLPSEAPRHRVRITKAFYLGMTEVTQAQYERVMATNPSRFKGDPTRPVEMVIWNDAVAFCEKLDELSKEQIPRAVYRLPTEAEWEYACRAGTTTRWYGTDEEAALQEQAWFAANSGGTTHPVGQKSPNAWRLYDMLGNVWEWCADWYAEGYYTESLVDDPAGPTAGEFRVLRGGSWLITAGRCRSANRSMEKPGIRSDYLGFRVAFSLVE